MAGALGLLTVLLGTSGCDEVPFGRWTIIGTAGPNNDVLDGGPGRDTLIGSPGHDRVSGFEKIL